MDIKATVAKLTRMGKIQFSFKKLPVDADGKAYDSIEDFQAAQIARLITDDGTVKMALGDNEVPLDVAKVLVKNKDAMIEILQINFDSRPGARGQKRPRKAKENQPQLNVA